MVAAFGRGLGELGYVNGRNVAIEYRWAQGHYDLLPALAAELVDRNVDLIAAAGIPPALAAKKATTAIPIVFNGSDPVEHGLIASLARPGGNVTGVSFLAVELHPKRLELVCEIAPQARTVALLVNPSNANTKRVIAAVQDAARTKEVQLNILSAGTASEIEASFASLVQLQVGALLVGADAFFDSQHKHIVALAARHAVPAIYYWRNYVEAGGLISYGPSLVTAYRQVGIYAGRILKGEKPADLPVQQPTHFELVVNLKTASALGLTIPPSILARADEVIE